MQVTRLRDDARACHAAAVAAVEPGRLVASALGREADGRLVLRDAAGGTLARHAGPVLAIAVGKPALAMARAAAKALPGAGVLALAPHDVPGTVPAGVTVLRGAHPVPDADGAAATATLLDAVAAAGSDTLVLVLLGGGASALLVAPAPGVDLAAKQAVTRALLAAGADVGDLNVVRKHCSRVKGGGLRRAAAGAAACWTLLLSDVVGDDPATIGSGPTVPDPSTFADAAAVLARRLRPDAVPPAVAARVAAGVAGRVAETLKPGDPLAARTVLRLLAGNRTAVDAAAAEASRRGYAVTVVAEPVTGDAAVAAARLVAALDRLPRDRPVALVAGGETTVRVVPGGRGGRSQHLALAAAVGIAGRPGVFLAAGTDGVDGPTDAAGACVDGGTCARARAAGREPAAALAATDAHPLLAATGDLLRTGPTGTNVADVVVALRSAC